MAKEILLAEDNPADVYLIRRALQKHGVDYAVHVSPDGREALKAVSLQQSRVDGSGLALIILDLNLPSHSGIEILERVRATDELNHVPVVVLTSSDSPHDRRLASELGATMYVRKPGSLEEFLSLGILFKELLDQPSAARSEGL